MSVTMQKIAELSGVSRGTVDRVLHNRGRVDSEVEERVRRIARETGYMTREEKKNRKISGREQEKKRRRIGIVTQLSGASFMLSIRHGLLDAKEEAKAYGIDVVLLECEDVDEKEQIDALSELDSMGVDGLAIMPVECEGVRNRIRQMIRENHVQVVTFNTDIVGTRRSAFIGMDNRQGGRAAAGLLGTLMRGKGSVMAVIGNFSNSTSLLRVEGFTEEMQRSFPDITMLGVHPSMDSQEEVADILKNTLRRNPELGGIMMVSSGQMGIRDALEDPEIREIIAQRKDGRRPYIVIYDLTPRNKLLLQNDIVDFVIDQDGYNQGFRAVMTLVSMLMNKTLSWQENLFTDITIRTKFTI